MSSAVIQKSEALRRRVLEASRAHKASWIHLGQYLFSIYKDKLYRDWGYLTFEAYCEKEVRIKPPAAMKMLRSYAFLEKEEPGLVSGDRHDEEASLVVPHYETVNMLRLAKANPNLRQEDLSEIRRAVLEAGKEPKEVRAQVREILEGHKDFSEKEEKEIKRRSKIKRLISMLKASKSDLESEGLLPGYLFREIQTLISKLEDQIEA